MCSFSSIAITVGDQYVYVLCMYCVCLHGYEHTQVFVLSHMCMDGYIPRYLQLHKYVFLWKKSVPAQVLYIVLSISSTTKLNKKEL